MSEADGLVLEVTLRNLLSFGPNTPPTKLRRLNVLIGPNGSGKSNFIEAVTLLRAAPRDLRTPIIGDGGVTEWIWKGDPGGEASLDFVVANPAGRQPLRHVVAFAQSRHAFHLTDERIENESPYAGYADPYFYYRYQHGALSVLDSHPVRSRAASFGLH